MKQPLRAELNLLEIDLEDQGARSGSASGPCTWAHLQRELKVLTTFRFPENREFAHWAFPTIHAVRKAHRNHHQGQLILAEFRVLRPILEAELADVLEHFLKGRWPLIPKP
jgi:hypothetical protein